MEEPIQIPVNLPVVNPNKDEKGRFKKGHKLTEGGDPYGNMRRKLRDAFMKATKLCDIKRVHAVLLDKALMGDINAIRLFLETTGVKTNEAKIDLTHNVIDPVEASKIVSHFFGMYEAETQPVIEIGIPPDEQS